MKEDDIRPEKLMDKSDELYLEDVKELLKHKNEFIIVDCPACGSKNYKKSFEKYTLNYVLCEECETTFINPRPSPELLEEFYKTSKRYDYWDKVIFPASEDARREKIFKPRAERIIEICKRHNTKRDTIMDVGAGFGTFCEEIKKLNFFKRVIAVEPTPSLAETCSKRKLEVINKRIEEVKINMNVDVVTCFEVIEHLFSPKEFILGCKSIISKNGIIVITCPNIKGFDISLLKEVSESIDTEHLNYFNLNSLSSLLESCGFQVIEKLTPGKLDAELVRKKILEKEFNINENSFLKQILIDNWNNLGDKFQAFLSENLLSSHMWIIGKKL
jgi:2-polyprenyl-3-methyl-5-hydroxy-6-metoxy-1,4-benzoquinol methylase/ribosomal protein S27E